MLITPERLFDHWALHGSIFLDLLTPKNPIIFSICVHSLLNWFCNGCNSIVIPLSDMFTSVRDHFFEERVGIDFSRLVFIFEC